MFPKYIRLKVLMNIDFTWRISSLYANFTPIIFNILVNNSYDDITNARFSDKKNNSK